MFTGIHQGLFKVVALTRGDHFLSYEVMLNAKLVRGLSAGDSIAVDGVCQTVEAIQDHRVSFTAGAETLQKTTLHQLQVGQQVAIERSAQVGKEIGEAIGPNRHMMIQVSADMMPYLFHKGFISVDGASLTINEIDEAHHTFSVLLIPHTLKATLFGEKKIGDRLNIEPDPQTVTIVDTVRRVMNQMDAYSSR
jgi:riboflavin synthase